MIKALNLPQNPGRRLAPIAFILRSSGKGSVYWHCGYRMDHKKCCFVFRFWRTTRSPPHSWQALLTFLPVGILAIAPLHSAKKTSLGVERSQRPYTPCQPP